MSGEPASLEPSDRAAATPPRLVVHPNLRAQADPSLVVQARRLAEQLPDPGSLEPETWLMVSPGPSAGATFIQRLLSRGRRSVHLAVRCSALVFRGYCDVYADAEGMAFGRAPPS